ncbi:MAG: DNA translocase FtsK 4TM domain-containing protein [Proteobacteria bacterium]|nr:DNA translocase FtsK 4TM domain-containing protein [Pseudomonadota bacterium]MBI3499719.1 DNA translocase FtsK 4TM domain-containing protein [Pseudomonadota bacterium]
MAANAIKRSGFLPDGADSFLRGRAQELAGLALVGLTGFLAGALIGYQPGDRSWNVAADGPVANPLGRIGAIIADVLLQSLGLAAILPVVVALAWGVRLMVHRPVGRASLRLTALPIAILAAAASLSPLPAPPLWMAPVGLGGAAGQLIHANLVGWVPPIAGIAAQSLLSLIGAGVATLALAVAFGFSIKEWIEVACATLEAILVTSRFAVRAGVVGGRFGSRAARRGYDMAAGIAQLKRVEPRLVIRGDRKAADEDEDDALLLDTPLASPPRAVLRESLVAPKADRPAPGRKAQQAQRQPALALESAGEYSLPPITLLSVPKAIAGTQLDDAALQQNARLLESVLQDFGVKGEIVKVRPGPVVTLYELEPAPGIKSSRVIGLADDIARSMSAIAVRVAVIPGRNVIGIELPNARRETVYLRELLASEAYERNPAKLALILGKDIGGAPVIVDLARMPHLLIAGTTGSGKSVAINTMILSLLYRMPPEKCRFIMVDPKMLELSVYDGIPHLLAPVVTEPKKAIVALKWTVREMENRYRSMSKLGVRNIEGYNARLEEARAKGEVLKRRVQTGFDGDTGKPVFEDEPLDLTDLPYIVVVVDEMADLMLVAGKDIEWAIQRLAQMARAAGIHLLMATQRPSVDVITGTIKANFPTRISFQVTSKIDSRTILGEQGAEQLLGQGDMLYMAGGGRITRVHGPFVTDGEVEDVVRFLKAQGQPDYLDAVTEDEEPELDPAGMGEGGSGDDLYDQAVAIVTREKKASTSFIQRHLQIGYNRAARIIERMEADGVISTANHVGKREVLARSADDAA